MTIDATTESPCQVYSTHDAFRLIFDPKKPKTRVKIRFLKDVSAKN
jgi:hypothetical protein